MLVGYQKSIILSKNISLLQGGKNPHSFKGAALNFPNFLQATNLGLEIETSHCRHMVMVRVRPRVRVRIRYDYNEHKLWTAPGAGA